MFLLLIVLLSLNLGCSEDDVLYQGTIVSLNNGTGCNDIIKINKSIPYGLLANSTISFNSNSYNGKLNVGDKVRFKILKYEKYLPQIIPDVCSAPQYVGQLEIYK